MRALIDSSYSRFYAFTFTTGEMLLLCNQIWIWEHIYNLLKKKILLLQFRAIKICEAYSASGLVLTKRTKLLRHFNNFSSESSILFGKLKLSIFVSTSYCINTVNLCFNFHQGLIKMLQKFCLSKELKTMQQPFWHLSRDVYHKQICKKLPEPKIRQFICKSAIKQNYCKCIKHPIIDIFCSEIVKMLDNFPFISSNICLPAFYFQVLVTLSYLQNRLISLS